MSDEVEHSLLSPSKAERYMNCWGSVQFHQDTSSAYAEEGTAAHELASTALQEGKDTDAYIGRVFNNHEVDATMAEEVQKYVTLVRGLQTGVMDEGLLWVEERVALDHILGAGEGGTSDAIILVDDELIVVDLKYGQGVKVYAKDNKQLMLYALGALQHVENTMGDVGLNNIRLMIHQPRLNHLDEHVMSVEELNQFAAEAKHAADTVRAALHASVTGRADPTWEALYLRPSEGACRWCSHKPKCPALAKTAITFANQGPRTMAVDADFKKLPPDEEAKAQNEHETYASSIHELTPEQIGALYEKVPLIEAWIKALNEHVYTELKAGRAIPGFKLVLGKKGNRAWTMNEGKSAEDVLKSFRLKQDEMYTYTVISPTKAEELLAKEQPKRWKKLQAWITQSSGNPTVAPESDKRPAIQVAAVDADFKTLPAEEEEDILGF